jgi:hypothetical protein
MTIRAKGMSQEAGASHKKDIYLVGYSERSAARSRNLSEIANLPGTRLKGTYL